MYAVRQTHVKESDCSAVHYCSPSAPVSLSQSSSGAHNVQRFLFIKLKLKLKKIKK